VTSVSSKATTDCPELYGCSEQGDCRARCNNIFRNQTCKRRITSRIFVRSECVRGRLAAGSDIEVRIEVPFAK